MTSRQFDEYFAVHPDWTGHLMLSRADGKIRHRERGHEGAYVLSGDVLTVNWDGRPADRFLLVDDVFVKEGFFIPGVNRFPLVKIAGSHFIVDAVSVRVPGHAGSVELRVSTSDVPTFAHVFVEKGYDSAHLPASAARIIDLGANIGLASLFFANKYPDARIVAVEPDPDNFRMLTRNVAGLGARVKTIHGAAWWRDGKLRLHREADEGADLGAWGVRTSEGGGEGDVDAYGMPALIEAVGGDVDILKIDIEGAEWELFSRASASWLERVKLVIVETHDRFREGCEAAVRAALATRFQELPPRGEHLFFAAMDE